MGLGCQVCLRIEAFRKGQLYSWNTRGKIGLVALNINSTFISCCMSLLKYSTGVVTLSKMWAFRTAVPLCGQSTRNSSGLSPEGDCGSRRVNGAYPALYEMASEVVYT